MKRPTIALIDDDQNDLMLLTRSLSKTPFNPIVHTYTRPNEFIDDFEREKINPGLIMCDHNLIGENSIDVVKKLRKINYRGTFFVISGAGEFLSESHLKTTEDLDLDITEVWGKEDLKNQEAINKILEDAMRKEFIPTQYDLAIAGMGDLGTEIASQCLELRMRDIPCIRNIYVWSFHPEALEHSRNLIGEFNWTRVKECNSLDELVANKPDAFVIARGPRNFDPEEFATRGEFDHAMMEGSWQKVDECYQVMRTSNYNGLILPISNRVGPHCLRGLDWNPDWKYKIVSPSADGDRQVAILYQILKQSSETKQRLISDPIQLRIEVYGEHGEELSDLDTAYVQVGTHRVPLGDINPSFRSADYRRAIEKSLAEGTHPLGKKSQVSRKRTGSSPKDAANAVARFFSALSRNRTPYSAVQSYVAPGILGATHEESFLLQRVTIDFRNECVIADPDPRIKGIGQIPAESKEKLGMQSVKQHALKGYYPCKVDYTRG
ncbi:MAG: response regulator [Nanoarchaeota archaeon]|nr:response regulator [Nanoarchaeota archaeon]